MFFQVSDKKRIYTFPFVFFYDIPIEGWCAVVSSLRTLACGLQNGQFQGFRTMIKYLPPIKGSHDNT